MSEQENYDVSNHYLVPDHQALRTASDLLLYTAPHQDSIPWFLDHLTQLKLNTGPMIGGPGFVGFLDVINEGLVNRIGNYYRGTPAHGPGSSFSTLVQTTELLDTALAYGRRKPPA